MSISTAPDVAAEQPEAKLAPRIAAATAQDFTPEEFQTLVKLAKRAVRARLQTRRALQDYGLNIIPVSFYSNIPSLAELDSSFEFRHPEGPYNSGTIFDPSRLGEFLTLLTQYAGEFDPPLHGDAGNPAGFFWQNPAFSYSDAMAYYCVLRHLKPNHVVEVGSGFSTLVALRALEKNGRGRLSCVEPFPREWFSQLGTRFTLYQQPVQELDHNFFNEQLRDNDVLFIDSTHTVKPGSDCLHLYLRILPELRAPIAVHAHDIYLPFPLARHHAERHEYWTEQYLLYAYLLHNSAAKVVFGSQYHYAFNRKQLEEFMHNRYPCGGASLWFTLNG